MTLTEITTLLRGYWLRLSLVAILGSSLGFGWAMLQPSMYTSSASAIVATGPSETVGSALVASQFAQERIKSYQPLVRSKTVAEYAIKKLRLSIDPMSLTTQVSASVEEDTSVLQISATAESPSAAARLAEAWVEGMVIAVDRLESAGVIGEEKQSVVRLVTLDSATLPRFPSSPSFSYAIVVGGLAGLILGLGYTLLRLRLDSKVRSAKQISDAFGISVIGGLPFNQELSNLKKNAQISKTDSEPSKKFARDKRILGEAIKKLRTNLRFLNVDNPPKSIVITSALPNEGKSTVTMLLAHSIAEAGRTVIVVDADLRLRSLAKVFGVLDSPGVTDVLVQGIGVEEALQPVGKSGHLFVLAAGVVPPNPSELLSSQAFSMLIDSLTSKGLVLIDAPPLIPVTDAAIATAASDGALLVVRAGVTNLQQVEQAVETLAQVSGKVFGITLNGLSKKGNLGNSTYYGDYYGETEYGKPKKRSK